MDTTAVRALRLLSSPCLLALVAGCTGPGAPPEPLAIPDAAYYEANVQVVVGYSCGSLDCHGDEGRPLRIYARDGLRMSAELRDQPVTAMEAEENTLAFAGVDPTAADPDHHVAVLKPLAESEGGLPHVGEDVWDSRMDDAYVCVRDWLASDLVSADVCARAAAEVDPR